MPTLQNIVDSICLEDNSTTPEPTVEELKAEIAELHAVIANLAKMS